MQPTRGLPRTKSRGFVSIGIILLIIIGLVVVLGTGWWATRGVPTTLNQAPNETASTTTQTSLPAAEKNDFSAFARMWWHHGISFKISANGEGTASWRAGALCSDGQDPGTPPSCDKVIGNEIEYGGKATFKLTSIHGQVATGEVLTSNQPSSVSVGPMKITLMPYDMAEWKDGTTTPLALCSTPPSVDPTNSLQTTAYYHNLPPAGTEAQKQCGA